MYAVVDPATGETVKEYPTISDEDLKDAIARADQAHKEWSNATTVADRAALVRRVGELHTERRKELAEIIAVLNRQPNWSTIAKQLRKPSAKRECLCGSGKRIGRCHPRVWRGVGQLHAELERLDWNPASLKAIGSQKS